MKTKPEIRTCSLSEVMGCYVPLLENARYESKIFKNFIFDAWNFSDFDAMQKYIAYGDECRSTCLDPCKGYTTVHSSITFTKFPTERSIPQFRALGARTYGGLFLDESFRIHDLISVDAYFPTLEITTITTSEDRSIIDFISDIGGQLGEHRKSTSDCLAWGVWCLLFRNVDGHVHHDSDPSAIFHCCCNSGKIVRKPWDEDSDTRSKVEISSSIQHISRAAISRSAEKLNQMREPMMHDEVLSWTVFTSFGVLRVGTFFTFLAYFVSRCYNMEQNG